MLRGGYYTFKTNYILPFPVPEFMPEDIVLQIEQLVKIVLQKKRESSKVDTRIEEKLIDNYVFDIYNIDKEDREIIKQN